MGEVKISYFMSELFLEELPNINHFTSKSILFRINSIKTEPNAHLIIRRAYNNTVLK